MNDHLTVAISDLFSSCFKKISNYILFFKLEKKKSYKNEVNADKYVLCTLTDKTF